MISLVSLVSPRASEVASGFSPTPYRCNGLASPIRILVCGAILPVLLVERTQTKLNHRASSPGMPQIFARPYAS